MQTVPYYGFLMDFIIKDYKNENQAHYLYTETKAKIEKNFEETVKYIKNEKVDVLSEVYINGNKNPNLYIRVFVKDGKPVLSFERKENGLYIPMASVKERLLRNLSHDTWEKLNTKIENEITLKELINVETLEQNISVNKDFEDLKRVESINCKQFSDKDVYQLLDILNDIKEDDVTYGHSARIGENVGRFFKELGASKETQDTWRKAGYLHDIGKYFINSEVINKCGKFETPEREYMNSHAELGAIFLKEIGAPEVYQQAALLHHQFTNNYPIKNVQELGDDIRRNALVFSIVDIYDAMINKRQYHEPYSKEEILAEIESKFVVNGEIVDKIGYELLKKFKEGLDRGVYDFSRTAVEITEERIRREPVEQSKYTMYDLYKKANTIKDENTFNYNKMVMTCAINKVIGTAGNSDDRNKIIAKILENNNLSGNEKLTKEQLVGYVTEYMTTKINALNKDKSVEIAEKPLKRNNKNDFNPGDDR